MTKWQRFGDGTWVNVDHVEIVRVEEQENGGWQLTATFASGTTHPLGSHDDRDLLADCTDALLRGEVGEHLRASLTTDPVEDSAAAQVPDGGVTQVPVAAMTGAPKRARWRFWRSEDRPAHGPDARPDAVQPQPIG